VNIRERSEFRLGRYVVAHLSLNYQVDAKPLIKNWNLPALARTSRVGTPSGRTHDVLAEPDVMVRAMAPLGAPFSAF
jgi:hypothetical protein